MKPAEAADAEGRRSEPNGRARRVDELGLLGEQFPRRYQTGPCQREACVQGFLTCLEEIEAADKPTIRVPAARQLPCNATGSLCAA